MIGFDFLRSDAERAAFEALRSRMNVGRLIAHWRMKRGLTQDGLAQIAGTKQSRISELEGLRGNVRFDTLDKISRALGLEITLQPRTTEKMKATAARPGAVYVRTRVGTSRQPSIPPVGGSAAGIA